MNFLGLIFLAIYFWVQFAYTQKIYSRNYFAQLFGLGLINLVGAYFLFKDISAGYWLGIGSMILLFAILLYLIKKNINS